MNIAQVVGPKIPFSPDLPDTPFSIPTISYLLTEELTRRGHTVTVFAPSDSKTSAKVAPNTLSSDYLKKHHLMGARRGGKNREYNQIAHNHYLNVVRQSKQFDIIHNHELGFLYFAPQAYAPVLTTLHYHVPDIKQTEFLLAHNNQYIAISKKQTVNFPLLPFAGIIHHGVDPKRYIFNEKPKNSVAWLGRITPIKGCYEAIRAALKSKKEIHLAGNIEKNELNTPYTKKVLFLIKKYQEVKYLGTVKHKRKISLLKNAQAVLMPIRWEEPFGLVAIEAFACGTPVIAFGRGALPEIIEDGKTGFIVSTISEMARAINKIPTLQRKLCRLSVENYFNISRMADDHEKLFEKISQKNI